MALTRKQRETGIGSLTPRDFLCWAIAMLGVGSACSHSSLKSDYDAEDVHVTRKSLLVTPAPPCPGVRNGRVKHQPGAPARLVMLCATDVFTIEAGDKLPPFSLGVEDQWGNRAVPSLREAWKARRLLNMHCRVGRL